MYILFFLFDIANSGRDSVVARSPDSQSGGTGIQIPAVLYMLGVTKPAILLGSQIGASFDWG